MEELTIWTRLTRRFGDLMRRLVDRCNDRTVRLIGERLKDKQREIAYIVIELVENRGKKEEIEREIMRTLNRQKQKLKQLRQLKVDADKRFRTTEDRYYKLCDESSDIRKQREQLSLMPCDS